MLLEILIKKFNNYKLYGIGGWVVNIDGRKVKIKCDDYVSLHRMLDKLSSVNLIIESIADNKFDDLISKLPEIYRYKVLELSDKIYDWINKTSNEIEFWFEKAPKHSRKDFMIWCDKEVPKYINKYIKAKFLNREYNLIKSNNGSYKKIKDILGHNYELKVTL